MDGLRIAALITGASSGIGRAIALRLAERGSEIALVARRGELLEQVAAEIRERGGIPLPIICDVTIRAEMETAVEQTITRFGRLDLLINNAGRGHFALIEETPEEQIENIFRVNVFSLWYATAPAVRQMRRQGSGHIINISSLAGKIGYPANGAYVAAKHAVVGFTRALRAELAGSGIVATVVIPSGVLTEWATVTEGGAMLEIFGYEAERGGEIARAMGVEPLPGLPLLQADDVAMAIDGIIGLDLPELYTHPGSREIVEMYERDQPGTERRLEPFWLANREGYLRLRGTGG
ncbi:MAG: SDR family oxidoreductase [Bacteroidota bacterium]